jgi:hypothetical protein
MQKPPSIEYWYRTEVPKWWVAAQKWVAEPQFLTLSCMREPKFRH